MIPDVLRQRLFFRAEDVATACQIKLPSAHVFCSRYMRRGEFVRVKKDFYVLDRNWERFAREDYFRLSNFLEVPSYVSCLTALSFFGITTQVQRDLNESISIKRSATMEARGVAFHYHKVKSRLFFGFTRQEGFFIACPEKAFLDGAYLEAIGRYPLDWSSLDLDALDKARIKEFVAMFPERVKARLTQTCGI